jgi:hypothetical protein
MQQRICRCGQLTLLALDGAGLAGSLDVVLDPDPIPDPMAELGAVLDGRTTYTVHANGDTHHRHPLVIRARPAGHTPRQQVHQSHRCTPVAGWATMAP